MAVKREIALRVCGLAASLSVTLLTANGKTVAWLACSRPRHSARGEGASGTRNARIRNGACGRTFPHP